MSGTKHIKKRLEPVRFKPLFSLIHSEADIASNQMICNLFKEAMGSIDNPACVLYYRKNAEAYGCGRSRLLKQPEGSPLVGLFIVKGDFL